MVEHTTIEAAGVMNNDPSLALKEEQDHEAEALDTTVQEDNTPSNPPSDSTPKLEEDTAQQKGKNNFFPRRESS